MKRATWNRALYDKDNANGLLAGDAIRRLFLLDLSELVKQMNEAFLASGDGLRLLPQILLLLLLESQSARPVTPVLHSVFGVKSLASSYLFSSPPSRLETSRKDQWLGSVARVKLARSSY